MQCLTQGTGRFVPVGPSDLFRDELLPFEHANGKQTLGIGREICFGTTSGDGARESHC